jgi:proteasome lid subunit RPN8/RPN11
LTNPGFDSSRPSQNSSAPAGQDQLELLRLPRPDVRPASRPRRAEPIEYKVVALRDCPLPEGLHLCDAPEKAAEYWRLHVATQDAFNPEVETMVALHLNTRRRVKGHHLVAMGTLDTLLVHPREVFRSAIVASSSALVLMHNHPSGEPTPSEADIRVTRDLIRAGQLLKIEVLDHVIIGAGRHCSLKALGYFWS